MKEGVNQGCPLSSIFAALVLNTILKPLDKALQDRAKTRLLLGDSGDDGQGSITHLLAYVDDNNALVPHQDIKFCIEKFEELAAPLGCKLNPSKTRILTSCNGSSILPALHSSNPALASSISSAIAKYSVSSTTNNSTTTTTPVEVTDGLRVLGAPVGSDSFATSFFRKTTSLRTTGHRHPHLQSSKPSNSPPHLLPMHHTTHPTPPWPRRHVLIATRFSKR